MTNQTAIAIRLQTVNPKIALYASDQPDPLLNHRTPHIEDARTWKTEEGAQRWLENRPSLKGEIIQVVLAKRSGRPVEVVTG